MPAVYLFIVILLYANLYFKKETNKEYRSKIRGVSVHLFYKLANTRLRCICLVVGLEEFLLTMFSKKNSMNPIFLTKILIFLVLKKNLLK